MNIFSYWEGPRPEYIDVCLGTMRRVCGDDFVLVEPETVSVWIGRELDRNWRLLSQPALRADALRAALLATHGGWWLDADTVLYRHPQEANRRYASDVLYMTWTQQPRRALNGYIYMARGSSCARGWLQRVNEALSRDPRAVDWTDIGERAITEDVSRSPEAAEIPRRLFLPVDIDSDVQRFFSPEDPGPLVEDDTIAFGLNHSWFMYHKPNEMNLSRERWRESRLLIHRLLSGAISHA